MSTEDAIDSLRGYVDHGIPTGDFLEAVLSNDLFAAIGRADDSTLANLQGICRYVYHDIPAPCWGSPAKVNAWLSMKRAARAAGVPS